MEGVSPVTLGGLGSLAAGVMMYVIGHEITPETIAAVTRTRRPWESQWSMVIMLLLNVSTRARWDAQEVTQSRERLCGLSH